MIQSFTCTKKEVAKWRADKGALYSLMSRQKWWWEKKKETDKYSGEIKETCSKQSATRESGFNNMKVTLHCKGKRSPSKGRPRLIK